MKLFSGHISMTLVMILTIIPLLFSAQDQENITDLRITHASENSAVFEYSSSTLSFSKKNLKQGSFFKIHMRGYYPSLKAGFPELPVLRRLISVPAGADIEIQISDAEYLTVNIEESEAPGLLYPHQPTHFKNQPPPDFQMNQAVYQNDDFYANKTASVHYLGIAGNVALARLHISPVSYNPVSRQLKVLKSAAVKLIFKNPDKSLDNSLNNKGISGFFNPLYHGVMNAANKQRDTITTTPAKYVIIADTMFRQSLQPFVKWKTRKGFKVVEAYLSDPAVGPDPASIKAFLQAMYDNATPSDPAPSFILIVGDVLQAPTFTGTTGSHPTDLYYAEFTGDTLADAYFGRFSATDTAQLNAQIRKTLNYEQYLMPQPSYLNNAVLIAGYDNNYGPTHANGQVNYIEREYINALSGFNTHKFMYPASASQDVQVRQKLSEGFSIANYTAHGLSQGWNDPRLYNSDLGSVQNTGKYGLMIGNACLTNQFSSPTCFGEAVLRLENRGAIGYIGGSNNTLWDEDFYWAVGVTANINSNPTYAGTGEAAYDLMFHTHGQPYSSWYVTQGQMIFAGNLAVEASASKESDYYWEIYHLMGDPSLMPYWGEPPVTPATYNSAIPVGLSYLHVNTVPYATVALSQNDSLITVSRTDQSGAAVLNFPAFQQTGYVDIVITAQNQQPHIDSINIMNPNGPYVIHKNFSINDSAGNNNGKADYGEKIFLAEELENLTSYPASGLTATLSTADTNIVILDSTSVIPALAGNSVVTLDTAFALQVKNYIPDQHYVYFDLTIEDQQGGKWTSKLVMQLHAPVLKLKRGSLAEYQGNGNGVIESGETALFKTVLVNGGSADAGNVMSQVSTPGSDITITGSGSKNHGTLAAGGQLPVEYQIEVGSGAWTGTIFNLDLEAGSGVYLDKQKYTFMVGQAMEDFETADFNRFNWMHTSSNDWSISSQDPLSGNYSAKSAGMLSHNQESSLSISMEVVSPDTLSFLYKVSSEKDYDFLEFWMDSTLMGSWSDTTQMKWERASYFIPAGTHTFTWKYVKDYGMSVGNDCAWIDDIIFPPNDIFVSATEKNIQAENIRVFPNPASTEVNISSTVTMREIILRDITGKVISRKIPDNTGKYTLNTSNLPGGIYILSVISQEGSIKNEKIIIR